MNIRYDTVFHKKGDMVYISHLDLMTLFRRAMRRAGLPFVLTEGFSPRVKISMPKALKLGVESDSEEMSLWLASDMPVEDVKKAINENLPEGVNIFEVFKR
jgi:radical SAM-linked protein